MFKSSKSAIAIISLGLCATFFSAGCGGGSSSNPTPASIPKAQVAAASDNTTGANLLALLNKSDTQDNILISPVSLSQGLMLAYNGANGQTATQIASVLGVSNLSLADANSDAFNVIQSLTTADPKVEISIANSVWYDKTKTLNPTFQNNCAQFLQAPATGLDFTNTNNAASTINSWVSTQTQGRITQILNPPDLIDAKFVLANATYFHGNWQSQFNTSDTTNQAFTRADSAVEQVPMMYQNNTYAYTSDAASQAVSIPYGSGRLNMLVVLPQGAGTLDQIVSKFQAGGVAVWTAGMQEASVNLSLPRFKTACTVGTLKTDLSTMGMPAAFDQSLADFTPTGLVTPDTNIYVSKIVHEATIDVDETGTTATAVTGIVGTGGGTSVELPVSMIVNHPCFYAIYDQLTGAVLFAGVLRDPLESASNV